MAHEATIKPLLRFSDHTVAAKWFANMAKNFRAIPSASGDVDGRTDVDKWECLTSSGMASCLSLGLLDEVPTWPYWTEYTLSPWCVRAEACAEACDQIAETLKGKDNGTEDQ